MQETIKNAVITDTFLGYEDHGIATFYIELNYGGAVQAAGGYALDRVLKEKDGSFICRIGSEKGMQIILEIIKLVGVSSWEQLKGKHVRVIADDQKGVSHIGNILQDNWIDFKGYFKE